MVYPALLTLMRTPRLPAVDWTEAPTDLNGLVRFGERRNLVSARVPSRFKRTIQHEFRWRSRKDPPQSKTPYRYIWCKQLGGKKKGGVCKVSVRNVHPSLTEYCNPKSPVTVGAMSWICFTQESGVYYPDQQTYSTCICTYGHQANNFHVL